MAIEKMGFITNINIPEGTLHHRNYTIHSVLLEGSPVYIQLGLKNILPSIVAKVEEFADGLEAKATKMIELAKSKWLLREFYYNTKMDKAGLYRPGVKYTLRFKNNQFAELPYNLFIFSEQAKHEIGLHHLIRWDFLDVVIQCIELQQDKIKFTIAEDQQTVFKRDKKRENQLLEVWVALKMMDL